MSCAYRIGGRKAWTQRFRASKHSSYSVLACWHHFLNQRHTAYSTRDGMRLSGIGLRNHIEGEFIVSTDETARWDTMGDARRQPTECISLS